MIQEVKEERRYLRTSIDLFNKSMLTYSSTSYLFIAKVSGSEMRHINDKDISEQYTPQVNNTKTTKTKSTPHKKYYLRMQ